MLECNRSLTWAPGLVGRGEMETLVLSPGEVLPYLFLIPTGVQTSSTETLIQLN